jgi:hypothetical protein
MKGSHFNIGSPSEKLLYRKPEPNPAVDPPVMIGDFSIEDQKKRLGEASWTHGQSVTKYESI